MPGRADDLIQIPASLWERPEVIAALRNRDIGRFFALVQQYSGASQTQIGIACVLPQGKVSGIIRGIQQVEKLEVFERIASGLGLPDPARISLGLAPRRPGSPRAIPPGDTSAPQVPSASGLSPSMRGTGRRTTQCDAVPSSGSPAQRWPARYSTASREPGRQPTPRPSRPCSPGTHQTRQRFKPHPISEPWPAQQMPPGGSTRPAAIPT